MKRINATVRGIGHHLPERIVPNEEFEKFLDTTDSWIKSRTGIESRRFAADGETTADLGSKAAINALADAELDPIDIDTIVLATSTPDNTFPATATKVQSAIGMRRGYAFDVQAVCAGFIFALVNANALIRAGEAKRVLVVGAETFSRILDMTDRRTCVLFGDGAGAVVLEANEAGEGRLERGILSTDIHSDGRFRELLYVDGGVSTTQTAGYLRMDGKEIFRHAVKKLNETAQLAIDKARLDAAAVDWIVPHQANYRIISATAKKLGIPEEQVVLTIKGHGNTSAASIPLALSEAKARGQIKVGEVILLMAIGGGLTWGSVVLRW
ncbi:MAG: ketoacyl-ACP synthase III [Albidovulum sp.]|nr:ketoacyl-ACP synthase III [Albidovulum sp.]MDE0306253.1 ketoacyl-ACP synthase III [Albidovulum sp.]MDE0531295.1 ketoacyl-ACP synthase III [Albidovulum sp.]